jgi:hypothetical protein
LKPSDSRRFFKRSGAARLGGNLWNSEKSCDYSYTYFFY